MEEGGPEPSKEGGRQEAEVTREKGKCQGSWIRASSKGQGAGSIAGRGGGGGEAAVEAWNPGGRRKEKQE